MTDQYLKSSMQVLLVALLLPVGLNSVERIEMMLEELPLPSGPVKGWLSTSLVLEYIRLPVYLRLI